MTFRNKGFEIKTAKSQIAKLNAAKVHELLEGVSDALSNQSELSMESATRGEDAQPAHDEASSRFIQRQPRGVWDEQVCPVLTDVGDTWCEHHLTKLIVVNISRC